jgi:AcrR family transcriptional regulator
VTVADPAGVAGPIDVAESSQRARILGAALTLVSETGAAGASMRRLASACGLNVATIYHYFPSKADLLRALVEEQHYGERMATDDPPMAPDLGPHERFVAFFAWVVDATLEEETVLRLLVGEGMHGDAVAQHAARELLAALDTTVAGWLAAGFPELAGPSPTIAARLVRRTLLSVITERLATGRDDRATAADDLAHTLFG